LLKVCTELDETEESISGVPVSTSTACTDEIPNARNAAVNKPLIK